MIKDKLNALISPMGIFFIYIFFAGLAVMGFRFIIPGESIILGCFSVSWRLIRGLLDFLDLFPALVLSSLIIPFGFIIQTHDRTTPFSPEFLQSQRKSIVTAIVASAIYGLLFSLVLPLAQNYERNLISQSRLYLLALERANANATEEDWDEVAQLVGICERIWPGGPDHARLKLEAEIQTEVDAMTPNYLPDILAPSQVGFQGNVPVNATEALAMAETALTEGRFFDAHWLATLGGRLAARGSVETDTAARIAGMAWSGVNSMAPNARETQNFTVYRLKREGYEALVGEEWIRSYYIFLELLTLSPDDPDVVRYFKISEEGVKTAAFFIDEIELTLGRILTGTVFSFPLGSGRLAMRISSLSTSTDTAYGIGTEIMAFDIEGRPLWSMEAPYVKITPFTRDSGPSIAILLRALDRMDKTTRWEPEIKGLGQSAPAGPELVLPVSWDNFLLLSSLRAGSSGLSSVNLQRAAHNLGTYGYLPQVFEAELLQRFARPLFLLPLSILAISIGWQFRALKRPRYMAVPMLVILPLVLYGAVHFIRSWITDLGIWAVTSLGFTTAAIFLGAGIVALLVISLIILAAKHG